MVPSKNIQFRASGDINSYHVHLYYDGNSKQYAGHIRREMERRFKDRIEIASDSTEEEIQDLALASERIKELLKDQEPKRIIVRPPALINIVV